MLPPYNILGDSELICGWGGRGAPCGAPAAAATEISNEEYGGFRPSDKNAYYLKIGFLISQQILCCGYAKELSQ